MSFTRIDDLRSADGTRLAFYKASPAGEPRGDVLIVGGLAEHAGRYDHVAKALTDVGWRVFCVDLRGHGHSDGPRGHVDPWGRYVEDLRAALAKLAPGAPILAHSMGALVTLDHLRDAPVPPTRVALSAPLLHPIVEQPKWLLAIAGVLNRVAPRLNLANNVPATEVTRHPDVQAAYASDPLVFHTVTPRWFKQMEAARERVLAHATAYRVPALFIWGTADKIVDPNSVAKLADAWTAPKELHKLEGLYHEVMNEPERDDVLARILTWLGAAAT